MSDDVLLKRRREINRKAATKSRRKQKELALNVKKKYYQEQSTNTKLVYERKQLSRERDQLLSRIETHRRVCSRSDHLNTVLSTVTMPGDVHFNVELGDMAEGPSGSGTVLDRPSRRRYSLPVSETQPAESEFNVDSSDDDELESSGSLSEDRMSRRTGSFTELDLFEDIAEEEGLYYSDMLCRISPIGEGADVAPTTEMNFPESDSYSAFGATTSVLYNHEIEEMGQVASSSGYYNNPERQVEEFEHEDMIAGDVLQRRRSDAFTGRVTFSSLVDQQPEHLVNDFLLDYTIPAGTSRATMAPHGDETIVQRRLETDAQLPVYTSVSDTGQDVATGLQEHPLHPVESWTEFIGDYQHEILGCGSSPTSFSLSQTSIPADNNNFTSEFDQLVDLSDITIDNLISDNMASFQPIQDDDALN